MDNQENDDENGGDHVRLGEATYAEMPQEPVMAPAPFGELQTGGGGQPVKEEAMAHGSRPALEALLYDAPHYAGTVVRMRPDKGDEGEDAIAYSLASLDLSRLASFRAPSETADPGNPFHQVLLWVTSVTVWTTRPDTWMPREEERGRTWQSYRADTSDLGVWATRAKYIRVGMERADGPSDVPADKATITVVE
ncbi:hypothetical protein ABZY57_21815 [Streptomyces sp. NPDC006450]|uniref:hypothetical protein n=1 Tax=Streptomyces sp. NPDC006450 TaxID=3155458 RepID=UPI0033B9FC50